MSRNGLTLTEQTLLASANSRGVVHFQTYTKRRGYAFYTVGGRELRAAQKLVKRGLLREGEHKSSSTYVRYSMGYRQERWTDHFFHTVL
ncbi:MAG: hypothetical protein RI988_3462 [Pseudomonadota bacterium]|jgi:hypothetical protein